MSLNINFSKIKAILASVCVSFLFISKALAYERETDLSLNNRKTFVTIKPSAILLATGAGLELGSRVAAHSALGVSAEFDHYLVGGSFFAGAFGRQYIARTHFIQLGVGYQETFFHDTVDKGVGVHSVFGSEWQLRKVTLGADWLGVHYNAFPFQEQNLQKWNPGFPKLRIGWNFR